jgi:hypothetical protein
MREQQVDRKNIPVDSWITVPPRSKKPLLIIGRRQSAPFELLA